jgi:hypothetical protein
LKEHRSGHLAIGQSLIGYRDRAIELLAIGLLAIELSSDR